MYTGEAYARVCAAHGHYGAPAGEGGWRSHRNSQWCVCACVRACVCVRVHVCVCACLGGWVGSGVGGCCGWEGEVWGE